MRISDWSSDVCSSDLDGFADEQRMQSRVIECDPPRRLVFTWDGDSDVTIYLEPRGNEVLLTVVHRYLGSRNRVLMHSAGWHAHLALLVARTSGQRPETFWDRWIERTRTRLNSRP